MKLRLEETLAQRVREVAEARGVPLSHVADRAGIARSHLWNVLAATSSATLDLVQRLADVLTVEPTDLLTPRRARGSVGAPESLASVNQVRARKRRAVRPR